MLIRWQWGFLFGADWRFCFDGQWANAFAGIQHQRRRSQDDTTRLQTAQAKCFAILLNRQSGELGTPLII